MGVRRRVGVSPYRDLGVRHVAGNYREAVTGAGNGETGILADAGARPNAYSFVRPNAHTPSLAWDEPVPIAKPRTDPLAAILTSPKPSSRLVSRGEMDQLNRCGVRPYHLGIGCA